jgi:hypothetical protein
MSTRGGTVLIVLLVMIVVAIGLLTRAGRPSRRDVATLVVELEGAVGAKLQIFSEGEVVVAATGSLDTSRVGRGLVYGSGLPAEGQEVGVYHFESLRTSHAPCMLTVAVAGLGQDLGSGRRVPIRRAGDASISLPAAQAFFGCPDLVRRFPTSSDKWRTSVFLIIEGELVVTGREGDALIGTLTVPLTMSSRLF